MTVMLINLRENKDLLVEKCAVKKDWVAKEDWHAYTLEEKKMV